MYKIGEFSKITNLSVKTLRYYDEEKILLPSFRNDENGYRYYNEEDFQKAKLLVLLRELDFSISEIKDVLSICNNSEDLSYVFEEKKEIIKKKIFQQEELLKKLNLYTEYNLMEECHMDYKVEIKSMPEIMVASIRYKGRYCDVGNYIKSIYKTIKGKASGTPFNLYHDGEYKEIADIEVCVPIRKYIDTSTVNIKKLPSIKGVSTIHYGKYEELNNAYKALFDYASKNNINCIGPARETYLKGPGMIFKGNQSKYITEIIIPVEEI
ncbi:MerR family transcriptional regulator [Clostridium gasigenes]|uniref:MerR family transcriptional regulator n=1 Tax=Clostridium gasigenes TaxID=94869 RepID=UPI001C0D11DD|nr:MerR family transcriptional regulator [Clostridium gasigenes]MBU3088771.1 MerR family transcriptional regulator [Clostridium gasigenes]MBU3132310.1 MerR family transcriptional regulator [Clostridium gasigenes]